MRPKKTRLKIKAVKLATAKKLEKEPYCMFCPNIANTAHHFIHQSQSNYLRCDERNLIPICQKCHFLWHTGNKSEVMTLQLVVILGDEWRDDLIKDSNIRIKDTVEYWENLIEELQE